MSATSESLFGSPEVIVSGGAFQDAIDLMRYLAELANKIALVEFIAAS